MSAEIIRIVGARQNNLKNLSLDLPLHELIVITGVSGSGKSSLAFDTLYAEGQRRYVESFSAYARQFLERMDKPQVERVEAEVRPRTGRRQVAFLHPPRVVGDEGVHAGHLVAGLQEPFAQVRADKARRPGDQTLHHGPPFPGPCRPAC